LDQAFRRTCREIHLGQTSDEFKTRLGCEQQPLWFYARALGSVWHTGLTVAFKMFPEKPLVMERYDVFKENTHNQAPPQPGIAVSHYAEQIAPVAARPAGAQSETNTDKAGTGAG